MTHFTIACPTRDDLRGLIDGAVSGEMQQAIQTHLESCARCQQALASLVVVSESWDSELGKLGEQEGLPVEPVLSDAMQQMKGEDFVDIAEPASRRRAEIDFLQPSDVPNSIGRLGHYEVTEVVGQGGMGIVLRAFDPTLHRVVAVKVLAPYLAHNPHARRRFVREAQAIAAVSHDHVITIHAIEDVAEQPRIVMQYVAGRSLQQKIDAEGALELKEILRIGMQTASGLAAAHAQGLVHRDVKPSNILLENGIQRVKLTDFGLARAVDDASLTQSGAIAGTPQYMAPEQANGDAVDYRADLFSLGSVIYAMCVGHSPFRASTAMGVLKRVCHDPPRQIQELNPDIPDWLCNITMKLLAKKPDERFQSAKAVAEELENWLAHVQQPTVVAKPRGVSEGVSAEAEPATPSAQQTGLPVSQTPVSPWNNPTTTILFQHISGRLLLFLFLTGMTVSIAFHQFNSKIGLAEVILVGAIAGLLLSFWGVLFVALVRLLWGNAREVFVRSSSSRWLPKVSPERRRAYGSAIPPESLGMLSAIVLMVMGVHPLLAAVVALIVWILVLRVIQPPGSAYGKRRVIPVAAQENGNDRRTTSQSAGSAAEI
ncbi:protein kinase domain-containing protein [Schlesneria sp. DSM 10557]|uniref:serine/threonine-protein kinase n=1 Tax=Schlesneria sp. DSM 10557 TaxID=3044399 RepID=UPI0035A1C10B